ncbi:MAG: hypothetical protein H7Y42_13755 [Chitinophagaceae bacterium]|nr:hypothetical protein [Chitinophagaceae bacterium]
MKKISFLALALTLTLISQSQDKIFRKNGKTVEAKILEIGSSEIKYKEFNNPDGPIYVLETDRVSKIVFENGTSKTFLEDIKDPERYAGQRMKGIKFDFLGPLLGYTQISFEKSTGVGKGYEISVGVIGAGKNSRLEYYDNDFRSVKRDQFGGFASFGYKFGKLPDFVLFGKTRFSHVMQGTYLKPILYVGHYKENRIMWKANSTYEIGEQNVTFGALQIELGKQWVFNDKFLLDIYTGLGYGVDNKKDSYEYSDGYYDNTAAYNYANARLGRSPGLSATFAIKLGLLLK